MKRFITPSVPFAERQIININMKKGKNKIALILKTLTGLGIILCLLSRKKGAKAVTVTIIGGADGPTAIYIAGAINALPIYIGTAILALLTVAYLIYRKKRGGDN